MDVERLSTRPWLRRLGNHFLREREINYLLCIIFIFIILMNRFGQRMSFSLLLFVLIFSIERPYGTIFFSNHIILYTAFSLICRFVSHLHTGAEVILSVVKILCLVCQSTTVQKHLISLLTNSQVLLDYLYKESMGTKQEHFVC